MTDPEFDPVLFDLVTQIVEMRIARGSLDARIYASENEVNRYFGVPAQARKMYRDLSVLQTLRDDDE